MMLEKILERNSLYEAFLNYELFGPPMPKLNIGVLLQFTPEQLMRIFKEEGYIYTSNDPDPSYSYKNYTSFDDWLFHNGHYDCVDFANYPNDSLILEVKKGGRTSIMEKPNWF